MDAKYLLENPKMILKRLCKALEISFDINMLKWKKGGRIEDGIWAKYWYEDVHSSTGFITSPSKEIKLNKYYVKLAQECLPYYEFLTIRSIKL